jgi:hypothetical protein
MRSVYRVGAKFASAGQKEKTPYHASLASANKRGTSNDVLSAGAERKSPIVTGASYAPKNQLNQSNGVVFLRIGICVWSECQGHDQ